MQTLAITQQRQPQEVSQSRTAKKIPLWAKIRQKGQRKARPLKVTRQKQKCPPGQETFGIKKSLEGEAENSQ